MSINRSHVLGVLCVLATLGSYGCDDNNGRDDRDDRVDRIGPSAISFNGIGEPSVNSVDYFAHGVTLSAAVTAPQPLTGGACPTRPPFEAPFRIVATGHGRSDLFINEVQARFVDRTGLVGGSMTLAGPQLAERFGSTRIPAVGSRSFPLALPFGCIGLPLGTLEVVVVAGDSRRRESRTSLSMNVR